MNTDLKDIKGRRLKLGDIIAMTAYNYTLKKFGKIGYEYWFNTGKVYFAKGRVQWSGTREFDYHLFNDNFLILKRGKKMMVKVGKHWSWKLTDVGSGNGCRYIKDKKK